MRGPSVVIDVEHAPIPEILLLPPTRKHCFTGPSTIATNPLPPGSRRRRHRAKQPTPSSSAAVAAAT